MRSRPIGATKIPPRVRMLLAASVEEDKLIITPPFREWLVRNPNPVIDKNVADKIRRLIITPQRDRRGSWSASAAGTCMRRQELVFLGVKPDTQPFNSQQLQIFNNGTWVHLRWQAMLMTAKLLDAIEVKIRKPSVLAQCTLDGIGVATVGVHKGESFGFELKGRNDYAYQTQLKQGVDEKTRAQVDFQFALSGLDRWVILNENKNNQTWNEWVLHRDESRVRHALMEIKELNYAIEQGRLHPMLPECRARDGEWKGCPFGGDGGPCESAGRWPHV